MRRRRHNRGGPARILLIGGGTLVVALILGALAAVGYVINVADEAPKLDKLHPILGGGSSQVYASDGARLGFIQADTLRTPVSWAEIPVALRDATVAIEDQRFYKHKGVDATAIVRAAFKDVTHGHIVQGGSTLTMQLMRNLYLGGDQHTLRQKIIEAKLAIEYEKRHNKQEILTNYLNSVPYGTVGGQTALGVQAASRIFFDKPASKLDLPQAALLAGLPQAPSQYNPFRDAKSARERRNEVLGKMAELHYISGAQAASARSAPLELKRGYFYSERRENFFFEYVRQQLIDRYGARTVALGGLKVHTTIDLRLQRLARKAISETLNEPEDPAAAIVTVNPSNGEIEAMAESESYGKSQYNLAAEGHRQPGSTFKAIVLADALSRGIDPNTTYYSSHYLAAGWLQGYPTYFVKTYGGEQNGTINLVSATLKSDNTVYAQLAADLGEETVTQMAYKMGVTTHLSSYASEALGGLTLGVTPLEMAIVYATLADGGWRNAPIAITKVEFPDGHVDSNWGKPHRVKVLSEAITGEETNILHENVLGGTAARSAINCPTAAKTGTTSEFIDAWLDGYNSEYSTVVWMGYPNRRVEMTDVHGETQQGGRLPAQIWHAYMGPVTEGHPCAALHTSSAGISYRPFYGKFATTGHVEVFTPPPPKKDNGNGHGHGRGAIEAPTAGGPGTGTGPPGQEKKAARESPDTGGAGPGK
jgi:penicillin-binding protein 1A